MDLKGAKRRKPNLALLACAIAAIAQPANAAPVTSAADLEAMTRSMSFVESFQPKQTIAIGVVYVADGKNMASDVAAKISALPGSHGMHFVANPILADALATAPRFDALYLLAGVPETHGAAIAQFVREHRILSISSDPSCLNAECCVLFVQGGSSASVNIVMDTALSDATGTTFSSVFALMVKRK